MNNNDKISSVNLNGTLSFNLGTWYFFKQTAIFTALKSVIVSESITLCKDENKQT